MKKRYLFLSAIAAAVMMTSCSSTEESPSATKETASTNTLVLNINANNTTRVAGDDPTSESTIQNVVVGVFNSDGAVDNITSPALTDGKTSVNYKKAYPHVIVVANAPLSTFSSVTTQADFIKKTVDLGLTTATGYSNETFTYPDPVTAQSSVCLPMVGAVEVNATNAASATVNLYRLVSRISVASVTSTFSGVYASATFTPTEIFVAGVPSTSTVVSPWASDIATGTPVMGTTLLAGNSIGAGTAESPNITDTQTSYLTSGTISGFSKYYFYVFPGGAYDKNTVFTSKLRLYIKGSFDLDGDGTTYSPEIVYYPIVIGRTQDGTTITENNATPSEEAGVSAYGGTKGNQTYTVNVTIKSKGVTDLNSDIAPTALSITLAVQDWSHKLTQTNNFE